MAQSVEDLKKRIKKPKEWAKKLIKMKMNQKDFCDDHEIDQGMFSRWIAGKVVPQWKSIKKIDEMFSQYY